MSTINRIVISATELIDSGFQETPPMAYVQVKAANVRPPSQGETYRVALTASSVVYTLPSAWNTDYLSMRAVGADCQIQFGNVSQTLSLTLDQVSGGTPPALTVNNASGMTLKDGEERSFRVYGHTQFAVISGGAVGYLELYKSSNPDIV